MPTPVGPAKMKQPIGRFGSLSPARLRRTAWLIRLIASVCEITFFWISSSICEQPAGLLGLEAGERDAGHLADDLGDDLLVDRAVDLLGALAPLAVDRLLLLLELVGLVAEGGGPLEVLVGDGLFLVLVEPLDLVVELLQVGRPGHRLEPDAGAGLVDDVDRLVGQAAAGDVPVGQLDGGLERLVGDLDAVVRLVAVAQAAEDLQRLGLARRLDDDRLEPALQGAVLLDVLAVLVEGGGADALDLAAGQGRLEDVGGVDRPLGTAGADEGVQLVDEQDRVLGAADLVHDGLDPLLELAAVLGAGDHHGEVEHDDPPVAEQLGDVAVDDHLGQALDDRRLADARLAQEDRVVLGAAREDLDHPLDFILAADDRVQLALPGQVGQVAAERVQGRGLGLIAFCRGAAFALAASVHPVTEQVEHLLAHFFQLQIQVHQHLGGHALLLAQQPEQEVFGPHVIVVQVARFLDGILDDLLGPRGLGQLPHRDHVGAGLDDLLDLVADLPQVDVQVLQDVRGDAAALLDQAEQDVFGADVLVVESLGLLVGQLHHLAGTVGEAFIHAVDSDPAMVPTSRRPTSCSNFHSTQ